MAAASMAAEAPAPQSQQASQADVAKVQGNIKKVDDSNMAFRLSKGDKPAQDGSAVVAKDGTKQAGASLSGEGREWQDRRLEVRGKRRRCDNQRPAVESQDEGNQ
ncbi:hypothetical protein [Kocuria salsicia]|uniref:hypothetical protein n=1 Tax=Kocuria salsicia TaxID=664639 RepID=UPI0033E2582B